MFSPARTLVLIILPTCLFSCAKGEEEPQAVSIPLTEELERAEVQNSFDLETLAVEPVEWSSAEGMEQFRAGPGVENLSVEAGVLTGKTTGKFSFVSVDGLPDGGDGDQELRSVQVRIRAPGGGKVRLEVLDPEELKEMEDGPPEEGDSEEGTTEGEDGGGEVTEEIEEDHGPWWKRVQKDWGRGRVEHQSLEEGNEWQTLDFDSIRGRPLSSVARILLGPSDTEGISFEVESVRLVTKDEEMAGKESGRSWEGVREIFRDCVVSRVPETVVYDLNLPSRPWLDLQVAMPQENPLTFIIEVEVAGKKREVARKTLTTHDRWENLSVDLQGFAGKTVRLHLRAESKRPGAIAFWGAPTVRRLGARGLVSTETPGSPPRNVILMVMDTLRKDHLDAYGYGKKTAPFLSSLAADGILFEDCVSQGTWTKVAVSSIMTSFYPTTHGIRESEDRLPDEVLTLAEAYRQAGYATASYSSVHFTGKLTNLQQGFDVLHESSSVDREDRPKTSRVYVDRLIPWLEDHRDVPFFVFLHVFDPHSPFPPRPPFETAFAEPGARQGQEDAREAVKESMKGDVPGFPRGDMPHREDVVNAGLDADEFIAVEKDLYDGSILGMDAEIERLFEALDNLDLRDDTLVVFIADHGEEFFEHGEMFHGHNVYGELTQVPFMLHGAGLLKRGMVVEETVQSIDLMPTLLQLSGLEVPDGLQGRSLLPLLGFQGSPAVVGRWENRPAVSEMAPEPGDPDDPESEDEPGATAISFGKWKLVHHFPVEEGKPEYELFDREEDPLNLKDVAADHPEEVEKMKKLLTAWRDAAVAQRLEQVGGEGNLSEDEKKALEQLGYLK